MRKLLFLKQRHIYFLIFFCVIPGCHFPANSSLYRKIHCLTREFRVKFHAKTRARGKADFAPCKVVQESLGFRIPRCGFRILCLWMTDSTSLDSGFHNQQPGFWITIMVGFRIPLAGFWIPKPWIPVSTDQNYLDSGLPYMGGPITKRNRTFCAFVSRTTALTLETFSKSAVKKKKFLEWNTFLFQPRGESNAPYLQCSTKKSWKYKIRSYLTP